MIGRLKGIILEKQPPHLLLEVSGVGYDIQASMNTFYVLPEVGRDAILYTHLSIREDAHVLFGFHSHQERELFRILIKINGVGPKLALTLLSSITPEDFIHCVAQNDMASLVKVPGVGKKTAERLLIEMRDRLSKWDGMEAITNSTSNTSQALRRSSHDAISALVALGYKMPDASRAIKAIDDGIQSSEQLIRVALKNMTS